LHERTPPIHYLLTSFSPFQHDAACRVIARLKKERDESRALLALAERQIPASMAAAAPAVVVSNGKRGFYYMKLCKYIFRYTF
jgi:hypothetical protein